MRILVAGLIFCFATVLFFLEISGYISIGSSESSDIKHKDWKETKEYKINNVFLALGILQTVSCMIAEGLMLYTFKEVAD